MESSKLLPQVEALDDGLDDLSEALGPLLTTPFEEVINKLPVLERAKISTLVVYAIESLVFCTYPSRLPNIFCKLIKH